jgi:hypothetical protein
MRACLVLYAQGMKADQSREVMDFGAAPSRPRAGRLWRVLVYLLLLGLACAAIWWIDRGAMMTNTRR